MTTVLEVPPTVDSEGFESLLEQAAARGPGRVLVDARHVRWANPYGMIGLLALGRSLRPADEEGDAPKPILQAPVSSEVNSYLARMDFFRYAEEVYEVHGAPRSKPHAEASNVLLEITPVRSHEDVHSVIDHVEARAGTILTEKLGYTPGASMHFSMMLSEVCQNIIEHSGGEGWVGIQTYNWRKRLGRQVVVIAVMDLGVGFRGSLGKSQASRFGEGWDDATALEQAFLHGVTRFRDPGRGQGLKQIRNRVNKWGGKVAVRSGTARIADVPEWDDDEAVKSGLPSFPGAQILIVLPATAASGAGHGPSRREAV
jgi:hypothetical protein